MPRKDSQEGKRLMARREAFREIVEERPGAESAAELARQVGVSAYTIRRWMQADFPQLYGDFYAPFNER